MKFLDSVYFTSLLTIAAASTPSKGCGKSLPDGVTPGGASANLTIDVFGTPRSYLLHIPSNYNKTKPVPLYFSFAGASRNASEQEALSSLSDPRFNPNGISVYPNATNDLHWLSNPDVSLKFPNDLDFVDRLLDHLEYTLCVDESSVYATGKSNGGGLTNLIACNSTLGPRFAAFATVSGAYYNDSESTSAPAFYPKCQPGTKFTPFFEFHGLNDTVAPYPGKGNSSDPPKETEPGVVPFLHSWAQINGCPKDTPATHNESLFNDLVLHESWTCNGRDSIVQHYRENDLGHIWPSTFVNDDCVRFHCGGDMHYVFNATTVILDFFSKNTLPSSRQ